MLIDYTFFQGGSLDIEGITLNTITPDATSTAIVGGLEYFIAKFEPEYLGKLLGKELSEEFLSYLDRREESEEKEARWEDLISKLKWTRRIGKKEINLSPIANYIYFFYLRHNHAQATTTGVKQDTDDGKLLSPERKMVFAWNNMVEMNKALFAWIEYRRCNFPLWNPDIDLIERINVMSI